MKRESLLAHNGKDTLLLKTDSKLKSTASREGIIPSWLHNDYIKISREFDSQFERLNKAHPVMNFQRDLSVGGK